MKYYHEHTPFVTKPTKLLRTSAIINKENIEKKLLQAKLFKVQINLFDHCCWWEEPLICRWEPWEESEEFLQLSPEMQQFNIHHEKYTEEKCNKLFDSVLLKEKNLMELEVEDFDLSEKNDQKLLPLITRLLPKMPDNYKFYHEQLADQEDMKKQWKRIKDLQREHEGESLIQNHSKTESHELFMENPRNARYSQISYDDWETKRNLSMNFEKFKENFNQKEPKELFPRKIKSCFHLKFNKQSHLYF